jgi:hypothetical protein
VYILPLEGIHDFCPLTINDRRLTDAIAKLRGVTPDTIRHVARDVAAEGLAGRGAVAAAKQAQKNDELARIQANFDLLISLVLQTERKGEEPIPVQKAHPTDLEHRGRRAVARMAAKWGAHKMVRQLPWSSWRLSFRELVFAAPPAFPGNSKTSRASGET